MENANLSDGSQPADLISGEHAQTMYSTDQAETNMVKLVDGKLTPIGDPEADVSDDMPGTRLGSDEERALTGEDKKKYESSEAALRAGTMFSPEVMPDDPIAVAGITGNPDAGSTVNTGLPSEDAPANQTETGSEATPTSSFGAWNYPVGDMIPPTPGTPNPMQPVPGIPETPPYNPIPGPEIPDLPGQPSPDQPEIQEPDQPDRSHEVNATTAHRPDLITFTSGAPASSSADELIPGAAVPGNQYQGLAAGPDDRGMEPDPNTGDSARPYDANAKDTDEHQPGERPEEAKQTKEMPRAMMDESSVMAQDMISGSDRSDQKSTEGLDRKYNDPEAARDMAT